MKLLNHISLKPQAEFNHQNVVVIEIGVIDSLIYCLPRSFSVLDSDCCHSLFSRKKCPLTQKLLC